MAENNAVLDIIRGDHERIAHLLHQIVEGSLSAKKRKDAFDDLRREITRHSLLEEEILYPKLKEMSVTRAMVTLSAVHHSTADRLINLLEYLPFAGPSWELHIRELKVAMIDHMRFEEEELKALLPKIMTQAQLSALCAKIKVAKAA